MKSLRIAVVAFFIISLLGIFSFCGFLIMDAGHNGHLSVGDHFRMNKELGSAFPAAGLLLVLFQGLVLDNSLALLLFFAGLFFIVRVFDDYTKQRLRDFLSIIFHAPPRSLSVV